MYELQKGLEDRGFNLVWMVYNKPMHYRKNIKNGMHLEVRPWQGMFLIECWTDTHCECSSTCGTISETLQELDEYYLICNCATL